MEEIEKSIAQAIGYYSAGMMPDCMKTLPEALQKMKLMKPTLQELDGLKQEVADLVSQLKQEKKAVQEMKEEKDDILKRLKEFEKVLDDEGISGDEEPKAKRTLFVPKDDGKGSNTGKPKKEAAIGDLKNRDGDESLEDAQSNEAEENVAQKDNKEDHKENVNDMDKSD